MRSEQNFFDISSILLGGDINRLYLWPSIILLLIVIYVLIRTYKATKNVEKKLAEFSSLTNHPFSENLQLVEVHTNEHKINKKALGPLARIIDEYAVLVADKNGIITYANERYVSISGMLQKELIGIENIINNAGCHAPDFWREMWKTISGEKVWHGEIGNKSSLGGIYWIDTFIFPLSFISNNSEGYICFGTDITEIKKQNNHLINEVEKKEKTIRRVEGMLFHSDRMASLGTVSAGIAHEINNPVSYISSNITRLNEYFDRVSIAIKKITPALESTGCENIAPAVHELDFVFRDYPLLIGETLEGIERIRKIIRDLKSFSHEQNDDFALIDIHECIETALNLAQSELKYKVTLHKNYDSNIPRIVGSEMQLSQVFINLFINASHAIEKNGDISIVTKMVNDKLSISIADNGGGIAPEILEDIFEPFFTTKPVGQGTGLGLSISHDIIKRHGGDILVDSVKNKGSTFTITLPFSEAGIARPILLHDKKHYEKIS